MPPLWGYDRGIKHATKILARWACVNSIAYLNFHMAHQILISLYQKFEYF